MGHLGEEEPESRGQGAAGGAGERDGGGERVCGTGAAGEGGGVCEAVWELWGGYGLGYVAGLLVGAGEEVVGGGCGELGWGGGGAAGDDDEAADADADDDETAGADAGDVEAVAAVWGNWVCWVEGV